MSSVALDTPDEVKGRRGAGWDNTAETPGRRPDLILGDSSFEAITDENDEVVGVIGVAVFEEVARETAPIARREPVPVASGAAEGDAPSASADMAKEEESQSIGTGYGQTTGSSVEIVGFERKDPTSPLEIIAVYYDDMSGFTKANVTAHGPCLDGRKIPHLVAPGCYVDSTLPNATHGLKCGTSMASPQVSGGIALFVEQYRIDWHRDNIDFAYT